MPWTFLNFGNHFTLDPEKNQTLMDYSLLTGILLVLAGFASGFINTLAGNGSVFTLSLLLFLDMPVHLANGTNRVGAFVQSFISVLTFRKASRFKSLVSESGFFAIPTVIGSILGAQASNYVNAAMFESVIAWLMVVMLVLVLTKPRRWLSDTRLDINRKTKLNFLIFILIGFYAGFIQMGMGILYLSVLVLIAKYSIIEGNMIKIILTLFMVVPALSIFIINDLVEWKWGLTLAFGQGVGAWVATKFALENDRAAEWVRRLLVIMILLAIIKLFGLSEYIFAWMDQLFS
jgi:hypothetical protein